jgi:CubicO group peptidase (beta-lactamase class C family)
MSGLTMSVEAVYKKMDEYCKALQEAGYLNGLVLVAYDGRILLSKGYGMANLEYDLPHTSQTIFRIGSITKQFTALAIMLLQERNLLNVNDSISKYLPEFPNGEIITIHQLLVHTSGIPSITGFADFKTFMKHHSTIEESFNRFKDFPLLFQPGEKFEYNNSGYIL